MNKFKGFFAIVLVATLGLVACNDTAEADKKRVDDSIAKQNAYDDSIMKLPADTTHKVEVPVADPKAKEQGGTHTATPPKTDGGKGVVVTPAGGGNTPPSKDPKGEEVKEDKGKGGAGVKEDKGKGGAGVKEDKGKGGAEVKAEVKDDKGKTTPPVKGGAIKH